MSQLPYHAVDLPRTHGVVVACLQGGKPTLTECPYAVVWDGTKGRPLGRLLTMDEETPVRPKTAPLIVLRPSWRDLAKDSTAYRIAAWLSSSGGERTIADVCAGLELNRYHAHMAIRRLQARGFAKITGTRPRPGTRPMNLWRVVD